MEGTDGGTSNGNAKKRKAAKLRKSTRKKKQLKLGFKSIEERKIVGDGTCLSHEEFGVKCGRLSASKDVVVVSKDLSENPQMEGLNMRKRIKQTKKARVKVKKRTEVLESEFKEQGNSVSSLQEPPISRRRNYVVHVSRPKEVERTRENLPVVMMEQEIMEAIHDHPVIIVCGETGCGKTTQVPQFLYEAGYGSPKFKDRGTIGVTQPRRVAVLATARRVAHELNVQLGQQVGFQVRHDRKLGEQSCIKFMTDGILLRELQADFLLRKYSVIVLDEAHERSLNTDILIGMLSRVIPLRQKLYDQERERQKFLEDEKPNMKCSYAIRPLKLVIMSATLRVEDFTANPRMFPTPPPVLRAPARQFPVTVHFSRKTELLDYMGAAYKKVCAIHRKLPPGGILVFMTGQKEVEDLCRRLRKAFHPSRRPASRDLPHIDFNKDTHVDEKVEDMDAKQVCSELSLETISYTVDGLDGASGSENLGVDFIRDEEGHSEDESMNGSCENGGGESEDDSDLEFVEDLDNSADAIQKLRQYVYPEQFQSQIPSDDPKIEELSKSSDISYNNIVVPGERQEQKSDVRRDEGPVHVLPLYAMLPAAAQLQVFSVVPKGMRLIVVATNVGETSITIPGIRYVVDCGRAKERDFVRSSGVSKYEVRWISKASADQRAGRAGRTGPGHCYRLYSSAHFNNSFPQFAIPEINKANIEGVVLVMKCMGIDKVANFPFPSPPDTAAIAQAELCLKSLSALSSQTGLLTPIGEAMAKYPISPRHSRMLLAAIGDAEELVSRSGESQVGLALAYAVAVAAALSLEDPFLREVLSVEDEVSVQSESTGHKRAPMAHQGMDFSNTDHNQISEQQQLQIKTEKAQRKVRRNKANAAHAKFRNATSDAISVANALRGYEQAADQEGFCQFHSLHAKTMHEMSKLRSQLWNLVVRNLSDAKSSLWNEDFPIKIEECWRASSEGKLNTMQEDLIRKAICAGWADQVARRFSIQERANIAEVWKRRKVLAYRACSSEEPVFLHPSSSIAKEAPEFVVYNDLVNTSRTYMRGVTRVDSIWLARQAPAQCIFSKALADPPPWYDSIADEVMCWVTPSFGPHLWNLPLHGIPMKKGKHRTAVFAAAFLQGRVVPSLRSLRQCLTNDPGILLKPESRALKRVSDLMSRLGGEVDTRSKLCEVWSSDSQYLYAEVLSWVQSSHLGKLKEIWAQSLQDAHCSGEELYAKPKFSSYCL